MNYHTRSTRRSVASKNRTRWGSSLGRILFGRIGGSYRFVVLLAELDIATYTPGKQEVHRYLGPAGQTQLERVIEMY